MSSPDLIHRFECFVVGSSDIGSRQEDSSLQLERCAGDRLAIYVGIENDGDLVEVLRNVGSPEAMIPHFSLSLRNPFLQSRLLVLADLTDFGKQRVSHLGEAQEHTLFLVSFAPD